MVVRKRGLNTKRHTSAYLVGNSWVTRTQAIKLAEQGRVDGVRISKKYGQKYLIAKTGYPTLYSLPTALVS